MCKIETRATSPPTHVIDGLRTTGDSLLEWTPTLIQQALIVFNQIHLTLDKLSSQLSEFPCAAP